MKRQLGGCQNLSRYGFICCTRGSDDGKLEAWTNGGRSSAFLDEYLNPDGGSWREGDGMRFYMGTLFMRNRADLAPVYSMIFRRLHAVGADWRYHFPEVHMVELSPDDSERETSRPYSVSKGAADTLKSQRDRADLDRLRAELTTIHAQAREDAMDQLPPATVRAYHEVYGRDPPAAGLQREPIADVQGERIVPSVALSRAVHS